MRARDVIGRRIARVHQSRTKDKNDDLCWNVHGFTLANGRYVSLSVAELAHLREMNHSAAFWRLVESVLPQYKLHRRWLKDNNPKFVL